MPSFGIINFYYSILPLLIALLCLIILSDITLEMTAYILTLISFQIIKTLEYFSLIYLFLPLMLLCISILCISKSSWILTWLLLNQYSFILSNFYNCPSCISVLPSNTFFFNDRTVYNTLLSYTSLFYYKYFIWILNSRFFILCYYICVLIYLFSFKNLNNYLFDWSFCPVSLFFVS